MSKFKIAEYLGIAVIVIPSTIAILCFVLNKKDQPVIEPHRIENINFIESPTPTEPIKVEVQKVKKPVIKKEPIEKIDSTEKPKEIKEESKIDISEKYVLE